jgi:hypothetical protein
MFFSLHFSSSSSIQGPKIKPQESILVNILKKPLAIVHGEMSRAQKLVLIPEPLLNA